MFSYSNKTYTCRWTTLIKNTHLNNRVWLEKKPDKSGLHDISLCLVSLTFIYFSTRFCDKTMIIQGFDDKDVFTFLSSLTFIGVMRVIYWIHLFVNTLLPCGCHLVYVCVIWQIISKRNNWNLYCKNQACSDLLSVYCRFNRSNPAIAVTVVPWKLS